MPAATATVAGAAMSAVVASRRGADGSFTARLLIIASTAEIRTTVTGSPVTALTTDITATARPIDATATPARCSRTRPGSTPDATVRTSASLERHRIVEGQEGGPPHPGGRAPPIRAPGARIEATVGRSH